MKAALAILPIFLLAGCTQYNYEASTLMLDNTSIVWLGHASFMIEADGKTIYIDPYVLPSNPAPADLILVTHDHFDHLGTEQVKQIRKNDTVLFGTTESVRKVAFGNPVSDGITFEWSGISVTTTKAYNVNKTDSYGHLYHPNGTVVGYILDINGRRIYDSGDTDFIPEMNAIKNIDVAMLPIGGKFTMDVHDATEAAQEIVPRTIIPMHYDSERYGIRGIEANPAELILGVAGTGIDVRVLEPLVK